MTSEKCPKCGYVNSTTCSPNGIEGVWLSDDIIEKIDEMKISSQGEVFPRGWLHDHGVQSIRCQECHAISVSDFQNLVNGYTVCEICGYPCEPAARAWYNTTPKHLNIHQSCLNVEQKKNVFDEIISLIECVDDIEYIREACRERGLL